MKNWTFGVTALCALLLTSTAADAQIVLASNWTNGDVGAQQTADVLDAEKVGIDAPIDVGQKYDLGVGDKYDDGCGPCQNGGKCGKGGKGGRGGLLGCSDVFFDVELQFMRYFQEGGVTDVVGSPAQFDWDLTPRFELGMVGPRGLGFRMRYWHYNATAVSAANDVIGVEAYNFDAELFQVYDVACHSSLEISLGLRYADFEQHLNAAAAPGYLISGWRGWGGTVAAEARRRILCGDIYARGRLSVLVGDADAAVVLTGPVVVTPSFAEGNTVVQTELAVGYEVSGYVGRALLSGRIGAEWQQWSNTAMADTTFGGLGAGDIMEDAGWAGLVLGFGIQI